MAAIVVAGRSPADVTVTQMSSSPSTRAVRDGGEQDGNDAEDEQANQPGPSSGARGSMRSSRSGTAETN
jgi:hypothetical protein